MTELTFREFAQRYVLERARVFTPGNEREEGWKALLDVKTIFGNIEKENHRRAIAEVVGTQAGANMTNGSTQARGATAAAPPPTAFGKQLHELSASECNILLRTPGVFETIKHRLSLLVKGGK